MTYPEYMELTYTNPNTGKHTLEKLYTAAVPETIAALDYAGVADIHFHLPTGEVNGTLNVRDECSGCRYKVTGNLDELLLNMGVFTGGVYRLKDTEVSTSSGEPLLNRV